MSVVKDVNSKGDNFSKINGARSTLYSEINEVNQLIGSLERRCNELGVDVKNDHGYISLAGFRFGLQFAINILESQLK